MLKQFIVVAETLHFGRASETCHVSASALSRSIQRLEKEAGSVLFERNNRHVALTHAGAVFLEYARNALADWDTVRNRLMAESGVLRGEVRIYCSVTASYSFLFDILTRVRRNHPGIEIKLHTGDPEDAFSRVLSGSEDIAIAARPDHLHGELAFQPIDESPLVFIAARNLDIAGLGERGETSPANWADCPMILPERGLARDRTDAWFRHLGLQPSIYAQVAGNEAIVSMVSLGFGVGVVPRIVLDNSPLAGSIRTLDVQPALAPYEVGLLTLIKKLASPLIEAFWKPQKPPG